MWLASTVTKPPTDEPVSLEAAQTYLRVDTMAEDQYDEVVGYIMAARAQVEAETGTRLLTQTVKLQASSFADLDQLPTGPVQSITSISYLDANGAEQSLDPAAYDLFGAGLAWGIRPAFRTQFPQTRIARDAVRITAVVGYGDGPEHLPQTVRFALLMLLRGMMDSSPVDISAQIVNDRIWL